MNDEAIFATVPEISEETKRLAELQLAHYIWYEGNGARWKREYHCSCCHETWRQDEIQREVTPVEVDLYNADHGEEVICPRCGVEVKLMCLGRVRSGYRYNQAFGVSVLAMAPGNPDEIWIRTFHMSREYGGYSSQGCGVYYTARPHWEETARHRMTPGEVAYWSKGYYNTKLNRQKDIGDKYDNKNWTCKVESNATMFILQTPLTETFLRYCAWEAYNCKHVTSPAKYLCAYALHPQIEMFVKLGYGEVVQELVMERRKNVRVINWDATNPPAAFRMSKAEFSEWQKRGGDFDLRKLWQVHRKQPNAWELARLEYDFGRKVSSCYRGELKILAEGAGMELHQILRYFERQVEATGQAYSQIYYKWRDYIKVAGEIGLKLSEKKNLMPQDIYAAHDEVMAIRTAIRAEKEMKRNAEKEAGFRKHLPKYQRKYTASDGVYMIRVPETIKEIVDEGQALDHCVGRMNYINEMAAGRNAIVFLRRCDAPDKPWYTLEVSPKRIVQCEGARRDDGKAGYYGHLCRDDLPEDAKAFLDAWEAKVCRAEKKHDERKDIA